MNTIASNNPFDLLSDAPKKTTKPKPAQSAKPKTTKTKTISAEDLIKKDKVTPSMPIRGKSTRGRGDSRGRGGRGASRGGSGRPPKHDGYDKHSAKGRTDTKKATEAGWGDEKDPFYAELEQAKRKAEKEAKIKEQEPEVSPEPEDNSLTLDEYLASKTKSLSVKASHKRIANEGADDSKWKDGVEVKRVDEDFFVGKQASVKAPKTKKEAPKKVHLEFEAKFFTPPVGSSREGGSGRGRGSGESRSRGDFRGRGDSRGGRGDSRGRGDFRGRGDSKGRGDFGGRGSFRGGRGQSSANIDDTKMFPTLGNI